MHAPRQSLPKPDFLAAARIAWLAAAVVLTTGAASAAVGAAGSAGQAPARSASKAGTAAPWPAVNLWIELRQIDEVVRDESPRGGSAVVTGTARSAAPDMSRQWGTAPAAAGEAAQDLGQLRLRNGGRGQLQWTRSQFFEWVGEVWLPPGAPRTNVAPGSALGASLARQGLPAGRQLELAARWPGAKAPVEMDFAVGTQSVDGPGGAQPKPVETRIAGSVLVPLGQWTTLARATAADAADAPGADAAARGTVSTRVSRPVTLLQVRVRSTAVTTPAPR